MASFALFSNSFLSFPASWAFRYQLRSDSDGEEGSGVKGSGVVVSGDEGSGVEVSGVVVSGDEGSVVEGSGVKGSGVVVSGDYGISNCGVFKGGIQN